MIEELIQYILEGKELRQSLSRLRAAIKEEESRKKAAGLLGDGQAVAVLLGDSDPKVRKNAASLLGDLRMSGQSKALFQAYQKEEQMFIRSAYLKALAKMDIRPYISQLRERYDLLMDYQPKEEEKKHIAEELRAMEQMLRQQGEKQSHTFCGWKKKLVILLTTGPSYREVTGEKLTACRKGYHSLGVKAVVDDLMDVVKIRTFRELLFPFHIKDDIPMDAKPEEVGRALASSNLLELLEKCHKEPAPFLFRLEIRGGLELKKRSDFVKKTALVIETETGRKLINSTDDYEFEVRLLVGKDEKLKGFLKMNTIPMDRFSYRKHAISTSIHPSLAALLMELAEPYLRKGATVLDPCCGVGTMLIERYKKLPARELYGVDIFGEAIAGAWENAALAEVPVHFIQKDWFNFSHKYLFDEIISNLPLRGKKSKEEQDEFYRKFFEKSKEHLKKDGYMILYGNEAGFIKKQIRLHPEFHLVKEFVIRPKDQFVLYVISLKE